jgi:hypothetical protein
MTPRQLAFDALAAATLIVGGWLFCVVVILLGTP